MTTTPATGSTRTGARSGLETASVGLGLVAALLTTTLAFISLALGAVAIGCGVAAARRSGLAPASAAGIAMAATSIYVIVLEILVLGG